MDHTDRAIRNVLIAYVLLFCGCSAHQISFSVTSAESRQNKLPIWVAIYAPDSTINLTTLTTLSGGLCEGHEFQLHTGKGMIDAVREGLRSMCDSVIILSSPEYEETRKNSLGKFRYFVTPMIQKLAANVDFSTSTFAVNIRALIDEEIGLTFTNVEKPGVTFPFISIRAVGEAHGTGQDCHEAVPFLKKAGESAMKQLRDSIISRLRKTDL